MLSCIALSTLLQIRERYSRRKSKKKTQNRLRNTINTLETSGEQDLFAVIDVQQQKHFSNGKEKTTQHKN